MKAKAIAVLFIIVGLSILDGIYWRDQKAKGNNETIDDSATKALALELGEPATNRPIHAMAGNITTNH